MFNEVFGNQNQNPFLLLKSFCLRSNIKHLTQFFITSLSRAWNQLQGQVCLPFYDFTPSVHDAASM